MSLNHKTLLILGGTSGFGYSIAEQALAKGAKLIITGRDAAKLDKAVAALKAKGADVTGHVVDAADRKGLEDFFSTVGSYDHFVSMAGGFMGGSFLEAPEDVIRKAIEEKLFANITISRLAAPHVREGGSMVFTAGSGGHPHDASGAFVGNVAISTMVQGLAFEMAPKARVNAVAPTWTPTQLWRGMTADQVAQTKAYFEKTIPLHRTAEIAEVGSAYIFLMENGFITGQTITVDGGLTLAG